MIGLVLALAFMQIKSNPIPPLKNMDNITWNTSPTPSLEILAGDKHCGFLGEWNESSETCAITIVFATGPISCSPISSSDGVQRMICWYKPIVKVEGK